jgi:hypothetical protein
VDRDWTTAKTNEASEFRQQPPELRIWALADLIVLGLYVGS